MRPSAICDSLAGRVVDEHIPFPTDGHRSLFISYSIENLKTQNSTAIGPGVSASQCHSDESELKKSEEYKMISAIGKKRHFPATDHHH